MNDHLEFAKEAARMADLRGFDNEAKLVLWTAASASALIAIAEQLEIANKKEYRIVRNEFDTVIRIKQDKNE